MKHTSPKSFDRLAHIYRALEFIAFGRDLERTRFSFLEQLRDCEHILVLGEGDGRCLARLVQVAPKARIHCVDSSAAMLASAAERLPEAACSRVQFICADVFALTLPANTYDAVTTLFFLDCFTTAQVDTIVQRIEPSLRPGARWLFADFVLPPSGWRKRRAQVWLAILYMFFRWQTGLQTHELPHSEQTIERAGFNRELTREFQQGLLRTALFRRRQ